MLCRPRRSRSPGAARARTGARPARLRWLAPLVLLALASGVSVAAIPSGFTLETVTPGQTFDQPTGIAFLPDGRLLVGEKAGRVWLVQNGSKGAAPLWQRENEVLNVDDKGLLGVTVDPKYFLNHYLYLLYTVDPDSDGVDTNQVAFGRLARYQVGFTDSSQVVASSRTILMGATWRDAPEVGGTTHTIGSLRWGRDGSLLVSAGEGGTDVQADIGGLYPNLFLPGRADPYEDIGAYRAEYVGSLAGKILRLDPATGRGYPSNPFYDGNTASKRSRVWQYGLRNPFRFTLRPGTGSTDPAQGNPGTLYIGDVGWGNFEELDVAGGGGHNFGWPCREGFTQPVLYQGLEPAHSGCDSIGTFGNPAPLTDPIMTWSHGEAAWSTPPGWVGNCIAGVAFYGGTSYPAQYRGAIFALEYARDLMRVVTVDGSDQLVSVADWGSGLQGGVDLVANPVNQDLYYTSIWAGEVRRIRYTGSGGGNQPPTAVAGATPSSGTVPLTVQFSSAGSSDPDGDVLLTAWDFGDNSGSTLANPSHTYSVAGTFTVRLTVDDQHGHTADTTLTVVASTAGTFPRTAVLDNFNRPNGAVGNGWTGDTGSFAIFKQALDVGTGAPGIVYPTSFSGSTQEAWCTLKAITAGAIEHNLMLQVQGTTKGASHVEISWNASSGATVWTLTPANGWVQQGASIPLALQAGDRFGARVYPNGSVEVYRNATLAGTRTLSGWPYLGQGGRIGLSFWNAGSTVADDFGGGDGVTVVNTPPAATIVSPPDSSFYTAGQVVQLIGSGSDAQDPAGSLSYRWDTILHHDIHTHPGVTAFTDTLSWVPDLHFDGTPVWYEGRFTVTDAGGLADTVSRSYFPNVNLVPSGLAIDPPAFNTQGPSQVSFTFRNSGTMPDYRSHWAISARPVGGGAAVTLAEGDTLQGLGSSFTMTVSVPPVLPGGDYTLRVTLDTTRAVVETSELDNAVSMPVTVVSQPTAEESIPAVLSLSRAIPNPTPRGTSFMLQLPAAATVELAIIDAQGRAVWSGDGRELTAGRWRLDWPGSDRSGRAVEPGLYLARLSIGGRTFVRRVAVLR